MLAGVGVGRGFLSSSVFRAPGSGGAGWGAGGCGGGVRACLWRALEKSEFIQYAIPILPQSCAATIVSPRGGILCPCHRVVVVVVPESTRRFPSRVWTAPAIPLPLVDGQPHRLCLLRHGCSGAGFCAFFRSDRPGFWRFFFFGNARFFLFLGMPDFSFFRECPIFLGPCLFKRPGRQNSADFFSA